MTGNVPLHDDLDDHHIVPKSWGDDQHLSTPIDSVLNRTPLTRETNREIISNQLPCSYLEELVARNDRKEVLDILDSHFISEDAFEILKRNPFSPSDFEEFVAERHRTLMAGIKDLFVHGRLDLDSSLRDLDRDIENIELALRKRVSSVLDNDEGRLPSHVLEKISRRLKSAQRNDPALDPQTLEGKLEFADLREVQDTIVFRNNWKSFNTIWPNKNDLEDRFQKISNLRNSIRHSRTVDEITRKDGEVAILWFQRTLRVVSGQL